MDATRRNWKEDVKIFRERMGGMTEARKTWQKVQRDQEKAIHAALQDGPHTIPEIAQRTKIASKNAVWHVMALKRYGKVIEVDCAGDYYRYAWQGEEK